MIRRLFYMMIVCIALQDHQKKKLIRLALFIEIKAFFLSVTFDGVHRLDLRTVGSSVDDACI